MKEKLEGANEARKQAMENLKQQIEQQKRQGNVAKAGELQQKLDQMQKQQQQMNKMQQMAQQMAQMQQALEQGDNQKAADAMNQMAQQLAQDGIRVNGVAPGPFWTPLQPSSVPNEKIESFGDAVPYGRPGQPAEIASTYVYLASQESSYTSGETIVVSGGEPLH